MAKAYSLDLRERVVKYVEKGNSAELAATSFSIGIATIYRWLRLKKEAGSLEPLRRERAYQKIDLEQLKKYVAENPDHFLSEIAVKFGVTEQAIFYALKRLKITRKKRPRFTKKGTKPKEKHSFKN